MVLRCRLPKLGREASFLCMSLLRTNRRVFEPVIKLYTQTEKEEESKRQKVTEREVSAQTHHRHCILKGNSLWKRLKPRLPGRTGSVNEMLMIMITGSLPTPFWHRSPGMCGAHRSHCWSEILWRCKAEYDRYRILCICVRVSPSWQKILARCRLVFQQKNIYKNTQN